MIAFAAAMYPLGRGPVAVGADEVSPETQPAAAVAAAAPDFDRAVKPLLTKYCHDCHNAEKSEGELNLSQFATADDLSADAERLEDMLEAVSEGFMPPRKAAQPSVAERQVLTAWLEARLRRISAGQAGDPGKVVVRRLTHAELSYTLSDLTGIEREWAQGFPQDGSGGEGFSNTGQTLQMSSSLVEKYLALAQKMADHALLLPGSGPVFLESPVSTLTEIERARITLTRLDEFCRTHRLEYRDATPRAQLTSYAYPDDKAKTAEGYGHMAGYKAFSSDVPGATFSFLGSTFRLFYRTEKLNPTPFSFMIHRGEISAERRGSALTAAEQQAWENLWLDLRFATGYERPAKISLLHRWFSHKPYRLGDNPELEAALKKWKVGDGKSPDGYRRYSLDPAVDLSFTVLTLAEHLRDIRPFTAEELRDFANIQQSGDGESRTLMVPNHDAFDAFLQFSLNDAQLEQLWSRVCDPQSRLAQRLGGTPSPEMQAEWKAWTEQGARWRAQVAPAMQESFLRWVARAWRRPLIDAERRVIVASWQSGQVDAQTTQDAMRLSLVRTFMSPHFLYRMEFGEGRSPAADQSLASPNDPEQLLSAEVLAQTRPLDDFEMASRLSYFLWSSLPDEPLWEAAARGELRDAPRLVEQVRRMVRDPRMRRFSREMFGQWLGFYRFREFDRPNAERFPEFDAELRQQMYDEALDFCTDLAVGDRDIRLLLNADYAFLPRRLAAHYGIPLEPHESVWAAFDKTGDPQRLVTAPRISLAGVKRRGVLGWGAVLTATSHALRTSPVLRGNWVMDDLLGIPTPPPPNAVPELPQDERNDEGLTIGQLLARHRQDQACSICHDRIDPFGLALENFDPIGRYRERDLNGALLNASVALHDGAPIDGATGLAEYLNAEKQRALFTRRFSRKMLGFALGRDVAPGDAPLLDAMHRRLETNEYRFSIVLESIITSPQFRRLRQESTRYP